MISNIITPKYSNKGIFLKQIRSFVIREKKISDTDKKFFETIFPLFQIPFKKKILDCLSIFGRSAPVILEIGFGTGNTLVDTAFTNVNRDFIGIEVHKSSIVKCLKYAYSKKIKNFKIIYHDAVEVIHFMISDQSLSIVQLFFPDPWNKRKHHKRRIINEYFVKLILKKLCIGGLLHIITDCNQYAESIIYILKDIKNYRHVLKKNHNSSLLINSSMTKFEKKAYLYNRNIFDLFFYKVI
ncbi:tRNA (guanosine(46)-N7)-methyltransferase TrmB [Buchnera aphidicola]|uniref:tRNA (guanosine(46)-N7)-methyltransferase TrmB n=1 Tax=Buchnera aphidicola TaxID=9 RepID=UPI0031B89750